MLMVPAQKCGRPRSLIPPPKCETCRRRVRPCGSGCANWPRAGWEAGAPEPASETGALPISRVRTQRDWEDVPEHPRLRCRATGKRHHGGGGAEEEGEEEEEEEEGEGETAKAAGLLLRLSGSRRRAPTPLPPQEGLPTAGTLRDGSVVVKESSLSEHAGLGLFAGRRFPKGQLITAYAGPLFYPEQLGDRDASCADCL